MGWGSRKEGRGRWINEAKGDDLYDLSFLICFLFSGEINGGKPDGWDGYGLMFI